MSFSQPLSLSGPIISNRWLSLGPRHRLLHPLPLLYRVHDEVSVRTALHGLPAIPPEALIPFVGPFPGTAQRIVQAWYTP